MRQKIDHFFNITAQGSNFRREILAGVTTFMTMAYIVFVNPAILSDAFINTTSGVNQEAMFRALVCSTCLAAAIATFMMGLFANYPIALAPGMGLNAFLTYNICLQRGVPWEVGLGMVFISGVLFMILSVVKVREMIIDAIPLSLKLAAAVGIGVFIAFIGLKQGGVIIVSGATFVKLGDLTSKPVLVTLAGLAITTILHARKVHGSILIGIITTGLIAYAAGLIHRHEALFEMPTLSPVMGKLDILGALKPAFIAPLLVLLFFDMFDTVGTLVGVGQQGGFMKNGKLPRATRALFSDAAGTTLGSLIGTSTVTSYVESATGIAGGGRTGFANIVTGLLFIAAMFFAPLAEMFGAGLPYSFAVIVNNQTFEFTEMLYPVTAPALVVVGCLMMQSVKDIQWMDWTEAMPAFLTIVLMPLTFSISTGLFAGMVAYPLLKLTTGRGREVHLLLYTLVGIFIISLAIYLG
jgi:AGZA family xanthine/uracil permease-like MFS transporter